MGRPLTTGATKRRRGAVCHNRTRVPAARSQPGLAHAASCRPMPATRGRNLRSPGAAVTFRPSAGR